MDRKPQPPVENLPDHVLVTILQLVADSPVLPGWNPALPFPVAASRVSRRWYAVTVASPGLWTTIRLSYQRRSWTWAAVFLTPSQSHPLDISINFDSHSLPRAMHFRKALSVVGPHIRRRQVHQLCKFLSHSPGAFQLQSAHISLVDADFDYYDPTPQPSALHQLFRSASPFAQSEHEVGSFRFYRIPHSPESRH
ncbi:hypothetical protein C8J57DRAFT_1564760 [Mycena rebaudengoi]|nr:hypothetical protein C8J57DRAFT_1564760 [Mycena rebaudengoi]